MKILFVVRSAELVSRYTNILRALAARGHETIMLFDRRQSTASDMRKVKQFVERTPPLAYQSTLYAQPWARKCILMIVRSLWTYRRYLVMQNQSPFFRRRWLTRHMPVFLRFTVQLPFAKTFLKTAFADRLFHRLEAAVPASARIIAHIRSIQPDVVVVPIGGMRVLSPMTEYLKAAVALGIPTAAPTPSWDSLTTKASMTVFPDLFLLWNEFHRRRIEEHHGVPPERVHLIGAHGFDRWFSGITPSGRREEFCAKYELDARKPYVLYLGAAAGAARNETWLIRELRQWLNRSADPMLNTLQIVARPHPSNAVIYDDFSLAGVIVLPSRHTPPEIRSSHQLSIDTYTHAAAVTGIFTSAMMEAQIMDKPVVILLTEEYRETQVEAHHFQDFVALGSVDLAHTFEEFGEFMKKILTGGDDKKEKRKQFVREYLRPLGLERSAGEAAAHEIEQLVKRKAYG